MKPAQARVFRNDRRFKIVVAGRRWGKTWLAAWWLINGAFGGCDRLCYYVGPTYRQAKRIVWNVFLRIIPRDARIQTNEDELKIVLCNASVIQIHGADRADYLRGLGWILWC